MADKSNDEIANALKAFSGGNSAGSENHSEPTSAPAPQERPAHTDAQPQPKVARQMSPIDSSEAPSATPKPVPPASRPTPRPQPTAVAAPSPKTPAQLPAAQQVAVTDKQIAFKRTIIPLLLTLGLILPAGGVASIVLGDESPIGAELMLPIIMIVLGLLIFGVAVISMLQVKDVVSSKSY